MNRVLYIVIAFIIYGSLYPWQYRAGPPGHSALDVLLHSWPAKITPGDFGDIVVNLVIYAPVGMFGFLALDRTKHHRLRWFAPVLLSCALSASMEMLQVYDVTRVCSLLDLLNNTLGGALGVFMGYLFRMSMSDGVFLVFHWLGFQVVAICAIVAGKRPAPHFAPLDTVSVVVAWLLVVYLLSSPAVPVQPTRSGRWLALGFLALLIVRGLAPFHFQGPPAPFRWVPLHTLLQAEWIVGLPTFLEKAFYYGSAVWLIRSIGWRLSHATWLVVGVLALMEIAQRYLPGRTPETTDPFLALVLGLMLWLIEQDYRRVRQFDLSQAPS